jgi:hypothetical protein
MEGLTAHHLPSGLPTRMLWPRKLLFASRGWTRSWQALKGHAFLGSTLLVARNAHISAHVAYIASGPPR